MFVYSVALMLIATIYSVYRNCQTAHVPTVERINFSSLHTNTYEQYTNIRSYMSTLSAFCAFPKSIHTIRSVVGVSKYCQAVIILHSYLAKSGKTWYSNLVFRSLLGPIV